MAFTVLVTGGSGKLGHAVLDDLTQHNYRVINADLSPHEYIRTIKTGLVDLTDVISTARSASAIVHLAAIPSPLRHTPQAVFENNVITTFNVLLAASNLGIKTVIIASSLAALGLAYKTNPVRLRYLPVDEAHPLLPQDAYGISKMVGEELADGFARLNPDMSIVSFRFPLLVNPGELLNRIRPQMADRIANGAGLWSYLDIRDAAVVMRQALQAGLRGHEIFYVNAPDTFSDRPTLELVEQHLDYDVCDTEQLAGYNTPIRCDKARQLLNFNPRFGWRPTVKGLET